METSARFACSLLANDVVRDEEQCPGIYFIYLFIMKIVHEVQDKPTMQQQ